MGCYEFGRAIGIAEPRVIAAERSEPDQLLTQAERDINPTVSSEARKTQRGKTACGSYCRHR